MSCELGNEISSIESFILNLRNKIEVISRRIWWLIGHTDFFIFAKIYEQWMREKLSITVTKSLHVLSCNRLQLCSCRYTGRMRWIASTKRFKTFRRYSTVIVSPHATNLWWIIPLISKEAPILEIFWRTGCSL